MGMPRNLLALMALLVVAIIFVCACGGSKEEAPPAKEKEAEKAAPSPEPAADAKVQEKIDKAIEKSGDVKMEVLEKKSEEAQAMEAYSYDPINKVDPFSQSGISPELANLSGKDENVLTKYEIRYFRLVGVAADEAQPRAIFEDPRNHAYVVTVGTPIGRNLGVVEQILPDSVVIMEQRIIPGETDVKNVPVVIKLHPDRDKEMQQGAPGAQGGG
jgi:Tfp pilus assembly protein PilP